MLRDIVEIFAPYFQCIHEPADFHERLRPFGSRSRIDVYSFRLILARHFCWLVDDVLEMVEHHV